MLWIVDEEGVRRKGKHMMQWCGRKRSERDGRGEDVWRQMKEVGKSKEELRSKGRAKK